MSYDLNVATSQVVFEDSFSQLSATKISLTLTNENMRSAFLRVGGNASIAGELSIAIDATDVSNGSVVTIVTATSIQGRFSKMSARDDTDNNCKYDALQLEGSSALQVRLVQGSCGKKSDNKDTVRVVTFVVGLVVIILAITLCVLICLFKKGKLESCCKKEDA